jgi:AbrB family looped-hinge helix DNA binding protein
MNEMTVPIDQRGRIVLPKSVREELSIKPGDTLIVSIHGSSVTLTPNQEATGFVRKGHALVFSSAEGGSLSREAANDILEQSRDERHDYGFAGLRGSKRKL